MTTTSSTTLTTTSEEWRPVVGYEELYEVSDQGRVRPVGGEVMKPQITGTSPYLHVFLHKTGSKPKYANIHRLVAIAFIPNPEGKRCVDHRGEKTDNRASMLRWATNSENGRNRGACSKYKGITCSGYKGVSYSKRREKWQASIGFDGKDVNLGLFDTAEEAYHVYCAAAALYHGDFAHG